MMPLNKDIENRLFSLGILVGDKSATLILIELCEIYNRAHEIGHHALAYYVYTLMADIIKNDGLIQK